MTTEEAKEVCEVFSLCLGELLHVKRAIQQEDAVEEEPYVALVEQAFTTLRDLVIETHFRFIRETL